MGARVSLPEAPPEEREEAVSETPKGGPKRTEYEPRTDTQRLGYLIEECGEVLAAAGKSVRWGLDSYNPELPQPSELNREWLARELNDLEAAIARVREIL